MRTTRFIRMAAVSVAVTALLTVSAIGTTQAFAKSSPSKVSRVLSPDRGGTVRLSDGAALTVPARVMKRRGRVTVERRGRGNYGMHIAAPWAGRVTVTLPPSGKRRVLMHEVGGVKLPEGAPGQRKVVVAQLSLFSWVTDKVKAAACFVTWSKSQFLKCLGEKIGKTVSKDVGKWIAEKLGENCAATLALNGAFGGPAAIALSAFADPACVGNAGETITPAKPGPPPAPAPAPSPAPSPSPSPPQPEPGPPAPTWTETAGGDANTWTNYTNAGGYQGPTIPGGSAVQIACKLTGFRVANGNTWWYRIASSPWNNGYYVSADAFYNNGATSGSLQGTPWVDPAVADC